MDPFPPPATNAALEATADLYVPAVSNVVRRGNRLVKQYRFTEEQFETMDRTPLDPGKFVSHIERRWCLERLRARCRPKWRSREQGLVRINQILSTNLHASAEHEFDYIRVRVNEDNGRWRGDPITYSFGDQIHLWRRWQYSVDVGRGCCHWGIVETLPNYFMDPAFE
jgi:hypothetical protein